MKIGIYPQSVTKYWKIYPQSVTKYWKNYPQSVTLIYIFTTYINNI